MIPGWQNPHCSAPQSAKARWMGSSPWGVASPSMVTMARSCASCASVMQERIGSAVPFVAALLGADEPEIVPERLEQRALHRHGESVLLAVHQQTYQSRLAHGGSISHRAPRGNCRAAGR